MMSEPPHIGSYIVKSEPPYVGSYIVNGLLAVLAAFDLELRKGMREGGLDGGGFFIAQLLGEAGFGASARFLGLRLIDIVRLDRHVGHHGHVITGNLDEPLAD